MEKQLWAYLNTDGEFDKNVLDVLKHYEESGADGIYLYDYVLSEEKINDFIQLIEAAAKEIPIPLYVGYPMHCLAIAKEAFLAGATGIVVSEKENIVPIVSAVSKQYGKDSVFVEVNAMQADTKEGMEQVKMAIINAKEQGAGGILLKHVTIGPNIKEILAECDLTVWIRDSLVRNIASNLLELEEVEAVVTNYYREKDMKKAKQMLFL